MLFTDLTFLYFHLAVVLLRWALPRAAVGPMLLASSYVFYLSAGPRYALLIFGATVVAWWSARRIEAHRDDPRRARQALAVTVTALLGVLAYFKYANFAVAQGLGVARALGAHPPPVHFDIALPLAISFFTFELISYVVDVYRGEPAEPSLGRFALYVAYYPHLIAGPIVRAHELLPALHKVDRFDGQRFADGVYIALMGYLKKTVLADSLAVWSDAVFANPEGHSTFGVWMGVVAYTGQIFCDFSGYTDIARGASLTLGLPLPDNFDWPYLSTSITEFWRRWHMTLSRWLRDYLYISLGGNRRGVLIQYRNLLLTMLLGGLWHGANWTFVAWGAMHGGLLCAHKLWSERTADVPWLKRARAGVVYPLLSGAGTLLAVMLAWVLFRAPTFALAARVLRRMFTSVAGAGEVLGPPYPPPLMTACWCTVALALAHVLGGRMKLGWQAHRALPPVSRGLYWAAIALVCYVLSESRATFIYFQF